MQLLQIIDFFKADFSCSVLLLYLYITKKCDFVWKPNTLDKSLVYHRATFS